MKILYADDSQGRTAWFYARTGLAKAFAGSGHDILLWDIYKKPAFDMFDEFEPDLFIGQSYNLERGIVNSIISRPNLRVILKGSDYSKFTSTLDLDKYPVLVANKTELKTVEFLHKNHPIDFIFGHYHQNRISITHEYWKEVLGIPYYGIPLATDITEYTGGEYKEELASDIVFLGGYWPYKARVIDKWLFPLCSDLKLNIKIFGNKPWPVSNYCGFLPEHLTKHVFKSAKVCPNLTEPHSQDFGIDNNERIFKLLSNKCTVIQDVNKSLEEDFFTNGEVEFAYTPEEFKEKTLAVINGDLTIDTQKGYDKVMSEHTYFNRIFDIFKYLKMDNEAKNAIEAYMEIRKEHNV